MNKLLFLFYFSCNIVICEADSIGFLNNYIDNNAVDYSTIYTEDPDLDSIYFPKLNGVKKKEILISLNDVLDKINNNGIKNKKSINLVLWMRTLESSWDQNDVHFLYKNYLRAYKNNNKLVCGSILYSIKNFNNEQISELYFALYVIDPIWIHECFELVHEYPEETLGFFVGADKTIDSHADPEAVLLVAFLALKPERKNVILNKLFFSVKNNISLAIIISDYFSFMHIREMNTISIEPTYEYNDKLFTHRIMSSIYRYKLFSHSDAVQNEVVEIIINSSNLRDSIILNNVNFARPGFVFSKSLSNAIIDKYLSSNTDTKLFLLNKLIYYVYRTSDVNISLLEIVSTIIQNKELAVNDIQIRNTIISVLYSNLGSINKTEINNIPLEIIDEIYKYVNLILLDEFKILSSMEFNEGEIDFGYPNEGSKEENVSMLINIINSISYIGDNEKLYKDSIVQISGMTKNNELISALKRFNNMFGNK